MRDRKEIERDRQRQTDRQRQADKQTDRETDRQTDRQTEKQTDRERDRGTDRQTERKRQRWSATKAELTHKNDPQAQDGGGLLQRKIYRTIKRIFKIVRQATNIHLSWYCLSLTIKPCQDVDTSYQTDMEVIRYRPGHRMF